jgi:hypothetical protein
MGEQVESVDLVFFGPQGGDLAWGRVDDGTCPFGFLPNPTPGSPNNPASEVREPLEPTPIAIAIHPNPMSGACTVSLTLPQPTRLVVDVFDVRGKRVRRLDEGTVDSGDYSLLWNGRDDRGRVLPSGLYWARTEVGGSVLTRRFVRLR